jgi:hypothetical protein
MTNEQQEYAQRSLIRIQRHLQQIETGQDPKALDLSDRRMHASWQLGYALKAIVEVLPKDLRTSVQACLDVEARVWSVDYLDAYFTTQQKTSPVCLAAVDSL